MRKRTFVAAAVLGLGLGLLLLTFHSREAEAPSGATPAVSPGPSRPGRPGTAGRLKSFEVQEVRSTPEAGGTPALEHAPTEADGVLAVEVFAKERPVSGASVRLYWRGPRDPNLGDVTWRLAGSGSTDAQGRVRLPSRPGSYLVAVRAPGHATQQQDVVRPQGEALTRLRLTLEAGHGLSGRTVEQGSGEPLPLVELSLIAHGRELQAWEVDAPAEERVYATSDARGSFRVEGLASGTWMLRAEAPGHGPAVLEEVRVPASGPLEIALSRAGIIEGFVVDAEGRPAPGAEVLVSGGFTPRVVTTGHGGGFSAEVEAGVHTVSARRGDEAGALDTPVVVAAGGTVRDVRVRLGASALFEGRVVARASKAPVVGATVGVSPFGADGDSGRAVTDAEGRFSVGGLAPGLYDLVVAAPGFSEALRRGLTVAPGERFLLEVELAGTGAVEGTVRDAEGQPLAGARVEGGEHWTADGTISLHAEARTNAEGHYRLEGLASGKVPLIAQREGSMMGVSQYVYVEEGGTARADFTLEETGTLEGVVRMASGPLPGKPFHVLAFPQGRGDSAPEDSARTEVDGAGTFRMVLPPGAYFVAAEFPEDDGPQQREPRMTYVEAGKTVRVELTLEEPERSSRGLLRGRVLEPDGSPSPSALVLGEGPPEQEALYFFVATDEEGRFQYPIPSEVSLSVRAGNGGRLGLVQGARAGQEVVVRLQPSASVRGRVVRTHGAPVRGFTLDARVPDARETPWMGSNQEFAADRFELKDVPAGPLRLEAHTRDGARGEVVVTLTSGASAEVDIVLGDTARVRGRIVDAETRAPLAGASVFVSEEGRSPRFHDTTGADGRFLLEGLPAGEHSLVLFSTERTSEHRKVTLAAGQVLDVGDVPLGPLFD